MLLNLVMVLVGLIISFVNNPDDLIVVECKKQVFLIMRAQIEQIIVSIQLMVFFCIHLI